MSPSGVRTATAQVVAAHHHAFDDGLATHVGLVASLLPCFGWSLMALLRRYFFLAYRLLKRSTRPPVSTSFCLPV